LYLSEGEFVQIFNTQKSILAKSAQNNFNAFSKNYFSFKNAAIHASLNAKSMHPNVDKCLSDSQKLVRGGAPANAIQAYLGCIYRN
jgi:hypothetical protein